MTEAEPRPPKPRARHRIERYDPTEIEPRWQARWDELGMHETDLRRRPAAQVLPADDVPVPVGRPAHRPLVHRRRRPTRSRATGACTATTCSSRSASTPSGCRPRTRRSRAASTRARGRCANIENMRRQLRTMGATFDWNAEVVTADPSYYRWNQWFFLKFLEAGPGLPRDGAGRLVPQRQDAGARAGRGRRPTLLALRHAGRSSATWSSGSSGPRSTPTSCCDFTGHRLAGARSG